MNRRSLIVAAAAGTAALLVPPWIGSALAQGGITEPPPPDVVAAFTDIWDTRIITAITVRCIDDVDGTVSAQVRLDREPWREMHATGGDDAYSADVELPYAPVKVLARAAPSAPPAQVV